MVAFCLLCLDSVLSLSPTLYKHQEVLRFLEADAGRLDAALPFNSRAFGFVGAFLPVAKKATKELIEELPLP